MPTDVIAKGGEAELLPSISDMAGRAVVMPQSSRDAFRLIQRCQRALRVNCSAPPARRKSAVVQAIGQSPPVSDGANVDPLIAGTWASAWLGQA
ncbi:hypothetical protein ACWEJ6_50020 [Nonomuraea sp. NPDC004702]